MSNTLAVVGPEDEEPKQPKPRKGERRHIPNWLTEHAHVLAKIQELMAQKTKEGRDEAVLYLNDAELGPNPKARGVALSNVAYNQKLDKRDADNRKAEDEERKMKEEIEQARVEKRQRARRALGFED